MPIMSKRGSSWIVRSLLAVCLTIGSFLPAQGWAQEKPKLSPDPRPAGEARDRQILVKGKVIERNLAVGEVHSYEVALKAGQYVSVVFEKKGVALVATLIGPDGQKIAVFGSSVSRQGTEPVTFAADQSGRYRIEVRTFFKPTPPGRYTAKLTELRTSPGPHPPGGVQSCEEKSWLDREDKFLVDEILKSIQECMSAVARKLGPRHPEANALAKETGSQVDFLVGRWRWGEFVSAAYQESLTLDFRMLASAAGEADGKRAVAILREVADDVRVKANHCRKSTRGLGDDVTVQVETRKQDKVDQGWQVFYKYRIYQFTKNYIPRHFPMPSSPTRYELPAGIYLMWAEKPGGPKPLKSKEDIVTVGEGKQQMEWVLMVP
jgi:hypothetical protein